MADEDTQTQEAAAAEEEAPADSGSEATAPEAVEKPEQADAPAGQDAESPAQKGDATAEAPAGQEEGGAESEGDPEQAKAEGDAETAEAASADSEAPVAEGQGSEPPPLDKEGLPDEVRRILRLKVPVIVKLADKKLALGEVVDLSPGSIVEFLKSADTSLELLVNNKTIGRGMPVKVGEKFGLRIDEIEAVKDTIQALGQ